MFLILKDLTTKNILLLDKYLDLVRIPLVEPDETTLKAFETLKSIYNRALEENIKIWVTGSWAITGCNNGMFFKQINDIDITTSNWKDAEIFGNMLRLMGFNKFGNSPTGAYKFINKDNILVDYGSTSYSTSIFYRLPLEDAEEVNIMGFKFRIVPTKCQKKVYTKLLFRRERSFINDLIKLKILNFGEDLITLHSRGYLKL